MPCHGVAEVPKNLEDRDIKEAFEDIGRVTKCDVRRLQKGSLR